MATPMTFPEFITTLRQADEQATKGPWKDHVQGYGPSEKALRYSGGILTPEGWIVDNDSTLDAVNEEQQKKLRRDLHAIALLRNSLPQTIAIMEAAWRAIEDAPHGGGCRISRGPMEAPGRTPCTCWKSATSSEMDALAAKTP